MGQTHGAYQVRWEDDLLVVKQVGDVRPEDVEWLLDQALSASAAGSSVDILADLSQAGSVDGTVRRTLSRHPAMKVLRNVALFGMPGAVRVMLTLAIRAVSLVGAIDLNTSFHSSESDARAWLKHERERAG